MEISYIAKNDRLLRQLLADEMLELIEEQQKFFLVGSKLDALDNHTDVYDFASLIQSSLKEADKWEPLIAKFDVCCVLEEIESGVLKKYGRTHILSGNLVCGSATVSASIKVEVSKEVQQRFEEEQRELNYQKKYRTAKLHFASLLNEGRVLDVQRLLRGELIPLTMEHIIDLIKDDMGDTISKLTTNPQLTRFCRSINHPEVFGEQARHIVSKQEPPPHPMDLGEARVYIKDVAFKWLEHKAGLNDSK